MKKLLSILLAATLVFSLAACSQGQTNDNTGNTPNPGNTENVNGGNGTTSGDSVEISISWWGGDVRNAYTQEMIDAYSADKGVKFSTSMAAWDGYWERLATQAAGGNFPTVAQMDYLYISTYADNGTLADLTPFIQDGTIDTSTIDPSLLNTGIISGKQVAIPLATSMVTVPINTKVIEEAGLEIPDENWTWDEFEELCLAVTEKTGKYGYAHNYSDVNLLNYWVRERGYSLFSADKKSLGYDDDQIMIDFIDLHKRLTDAGSMPTPDEWVTIVANGEEGRPVPLGQAATLYQSSTYGVQMAGVCTDIILNSPPRLPNGEKALWLKPSMFFCIAASATPEQQKAAAEFINWFINSNEAADYSGTERGIPASSTVRDYLQTKELTDQAKDMFAYYDVAASLSGECPPPDPAGITEVNKAFSTIMDQVMYGQIGTAEAAASFRQQANDILSRNN